MSHRNLLPLALLFTGCVPVSEPLSDPMKAEPDKALIGNWESGVNKLTIDNPKVKGNPKGLMRGIGDWWGFFGGSRETYWFTTTKIDKHTYMTLYFLDNLKEPDFTKEGSFEKLSSDKRLTYVVCKYALKEKSLVVDRGNVPVLEELVQKEKDLETTVRGVPQEGFIKYLKKNGPGKIFDGTNSVEFSKK